MYIQYVNSTLTSKMLLLFYIKRILYQAENYQS